MANFFSKILNNLFQSDRVADEEFYEDLEEAMIQSDVSYPSCMRIIDAVKREGWTVFTKKRAQTRLPWYLMLYNPLRQRMRMF